MSLRYLLASLKDRRKTTDGEKGARKPDHVATPPKTSSERATVTSGR